jgi:hypothetical protein
MAEQKKVDDKPIEALGLSNGVGMNLPFTTPYYDEKLRGKSLEEGLQEIVNEQWGEESGPTIPDLVAMRRMDGQARALYRLLTRPILAALEGSTFEAAEGGEKEAEFITQALTLAPENGGMTVTLHRFMSQLLQALFDGFAPFEKVYHRPTKGPLKGKTTLKKILYLPVQTVTFVTDDRGGFRGLRQRAHFGGRTIDEYIEPKYAFYYAAQEEENPFYGVSYFQSAFYHYDKKMKSYFLAHLASQRSAVGTRIGTVPINATDLAKREFHAALSNLAFAQYMAVPEGFTVEILKEGTSFDFLNYINHHNSQMSKSILAAFFDESQGSGSNDNAMIGGSGPGDNWFMLQLQAIQSEIASAINNHIIPGLVDENFRGSKYPKFKWGVLSDDKKAAITKTFERLSAAGQSTNTTPEFMRELEKSQAEAMGLVIDYEAIAEREKEDAERLKEAGIDPKTGQPFPVPIDPATGLPKGQDPLAAAGVPGAPVGAVAGGTAALSADPDGLAAAFEQQALALSAKQLEQSEEITTMARDLLNDASAFLTKSADNDVIQ